MLEKSPLNDVIDIIHRPKFFTKILTRKFMNLFKNYFSASESIDILNGNSKTKIKWRN